MFKFFRSRRVDRFAQQLSKIIAIDESFGARYLSIIREVEGDDFYWDVIEQYNRKYHDR